MFILLKSDGTSFYLQDDRTYFVGRVETNIVLNDRTVSRKHAKIVVRNNAVFVEDLKSSNKTYVNGVALKPNVETQAECGNEIKFGYENSIFILQKDRIMVTSSSLSIADRSTLKHFLDKTKASLATTWSNQCTHVVCEKILITEKLLCALVCQQEIVNVDYFKDRWKHIKNSVALPKTESYRPRIDDNNTPKFDYNHDRRKLFKNKTFVFEDKTSKKNMEKVIHEAGGKSILFKNNPVRKNDLLTAKTEYLFIISDQHSLSDDTDFNKCVRYLMENGKRSIPLPEIAFAVLKANCDINCNPSFDKVLHVMTGERVAIENNVLAPETQTQESREPFTLTTNIIPATYENDSSVIIIDDDDEKDTANTREVTNVRRIGEDKAYKRGNIDFESIVIDDEIDVDKGNKRAGEDLQSNKSKKEKLEKASIGLEKNPFQPPPKTQKKINSYFAKSSQEIETQPSQPLKRKSDDGVVLTSKKPKFNFDLTESNTLVTNPFVAEKTGNTSKHQASFLCSTQIEGSQNVNQHLFTSIQLGDSPSPTKNPFGNANTTNRKSGAIKNTFADLCVNKSEEKNSANKDVRQQKYPEEELSKIIKPINVNQKNKNDFGADNLNYSTASTTNTVTLKWLSKTTDSGDFVKKGDEEDEEMKEFYKSFTTNVKIISEDTLIIRKPMTDLSVNSSKNTTNSTLSNFKRFTKVKPLHEQSMIMPRARFRKFVCNTENGGSFSVDEEQAEKPVINTKQKYVFDL